jgi:hypothetical protein
MTSATVGLLDSTPMSDPQIRAGTVVSWKWGSSTAEGKVTEIHREKVTRRTKGEDITRNGSEDDPAYVITQDDGTVVLKLRSEVQRA